MSVQTIGNWSLIIDDADQSVVVTHSDHPGKIEVLPYAKTFSIPITGIDGIVVAELSIERTDKADTQHTWAISTSADGRYLYIPLDFGKQHLHIKADDEGFVVDAWNEDQDEVIDSISATYAELCEEVEED